MTGKKPGQITALIQQLGGGNRVVIDTLVPLLYQELRQMAQRQLRHERSNQTLNITALVNEAYLKLADQQKTSWQDRAHFLAIASQAMRRILVDYARARQTKKRGGDLAFVTYDEEIHSREMRAQELIELDSALEELSTQNERQSQVVEYSFFGGLTHEEIAAVLQVSVPTVRRDWRLARAWLSGRLKSKTQI